jgi:hypothetical protein
MKFVVGLDVGRLVALLVGALLATEVVGGGRKGIGDGIGEGDGVLKSYWDLSSSS